MDVAAWLTQLSDVASNQIYKYIYLINKTNQTEHHFIRRDTRSLALNHIDDIENVVEKKQKIVQVGTLLTGPCLSWSIIERILDTSATFFEVLGLKSQSLDTL